MVNQVDCIVKDQQRFFHAFLYQIALSFCETKLCFSETKLCFNTLQRKNGKCTSSSRRCRTDTCFALSHLIKFLITYNINHRAAIPCRLKTLQSFRGKVASDFLQRILRHQIICMYFGSLKVGCNNH